jgi:hypothetical protein
MLGSSDKISANDFVQRFEQEWKSSLDVIKQLGNSVDAAKLFVSVFSNMSFGIPEQMTEANFGTVTPKIELLAYHLYPLFGKSQNTSVSVVHVQQCMQALDSLFRSYNFIKSLPVSDNKNEIIANVMYHLKSQIRIVRGSAYPEQTKDEIISIYSPFDRGFENTAGIYPSRATTIIENIIKSQEESLNKYLPVIKKHAESVQTDWQEAKKKRRIERSISEVTLLGLAKKKKDAYIFGFFDRFDEMAPDIIPVGFDDLQRFDNPPSKREWEALIELLGMTVAKRLAMNDPVAVREKPLFVLPDQRVISQNISHTFDIIWESYDKIIRNDEAIYQRCQTRQAEWVERKTFEYFSAIFEQDNIHRNLRYPNPNKGGEAEIDGIVQWGPFLVLVEVKARQFRLNSQSIDAGAGRLFSDIKSNVEDAFDQAKRALKYIDTDPSPMFQEISSGQKLVIDKKKIRRIYLVTVSQHQLAGMATRLNSLKGSGLFKENEYPFSICLADLNILSELCDGPDIFLHYIERRLDVQKQEIEILGDERDFFCAYLSSRLHAERVWKSKDGEYDSVWLNLSDQVDAWMMYKRGMIKQAPEMSLKVPSEIKEILSELRHRRDDGACWIAFSLLDMSDHGLAAISKILRDSSCMTIPSRVIRRYTHKEGDTVITISASRDVPPDTLMDSISHRVMIEKYRYRAVKSIGIGLDPTNTNRPIECIFFSEGSWKHSDEIEKILEKEQLSLAPGQKLPGVNAPCICGSGRKFKKCCLPKIYT